MTSKKFKILGEEPAFYVGVVQAVLAMLLSFGLLGLTPETNGVILAAVSAGLGLVVAYATKTTLYSALIGFAQAVVVLAVTFGLRLDDVQQGSILAVISIVAGGYLRERTSAVRSAVSEPSPGGDSRLDKVILADRMALRSERGRVTPLVGLAMAVVVAVVGAVLTLVASPAQAAGWSGQRCDTEPANVGNGWSVCVQVHTVPTSTGIRADQVQICTYKIPANPQLTEGTKTNGIFFQGSGGAWLGGFNLANTGASAAGTCTYTNVSLAMGNGACYEASGTVVMNNWPDDAWHVRGKVIGGAC